MTYPCQSQPGGPGGKLFQRLQHAIAQQQQQGSTSRSADGTTSQYARVSDDAVHPRVPSVEEQISQLDEEIEGLVTDQAAAVMQSVCDALTLSRDAPEIPCRNIFGVAKGKVIENYVWHSEENLNHVRTWLIAGLTGASQHGLPKQFFIAAAEDMYNYDRALRAAEMNNLERPLRFEQLPQKITRTEEGSTQEYWLRRCAFEWTPDIPPRVVDAVSHVIVNTPPDELWICKYQARVVYDPIVYATFGRFDAHPVAWHVEVARWD
jgi:hypothetical protein